MDYRSAPPRKNAFALYSNKNKIIGWLLLGFVSFSSVFIQAESGPTAPIPAPRDLAPQPLKRATNPTPPVLEIRTKIETFFEGLKKGDSAQAFGAFLMGTRLATREDNVKVLVDKTEQAISLYGAVSDYEVYDTYNVGNRVVVTTYLSALAVQPLRWRFVYYKAEKTWTLIDLRVDDSLSDLVE